MTLSNKDYKDLSVKEFTKAAASYEGASAGVYELCKIVALDGQLADDAIEVVHLPPLLARSRRTG